MAKSEPFEKHTDRYENWFEENWYVYQSEILALKKILPPFKKGIELGVGTGRFAEPLAITRGLEPSDKMADIARKRKIDVTRGVAEDMPFKPNSFDLVLMVTTVCFLDDISQALKETFRILEPGGWLLIGFIDKNSLMGRLYQAIKHQNIFYRDAVFYSTARLTDYVKDAGFINLTYSQTLFKPVQEMNGVEKPLIGYGQGSFIVIRGQKPGT